MLFSEDSSNEANVSCHFCKYIYICVIVLLYFELIVVIVVYSF